MGGRRFFNALRPSKRLSSRYSVEQRPAERLAALNSPNETDRKTRARSTGPRASGGARWDGLSPRLPLPLRCLRLPRRRRLRGFASLAGSALGDTPAPTTL